MFKHTEQKRNCVCGQVITYWEYLEKNGDLLLLELFVFLDETNTPITHCPSCGQKLDRINTSICSSKKIIFASSVK